jgi:ketosteroid isomerase-like protein
MSIEDKLAILEALAMYSHTLDNGDDAGWVQLFTEDAVWEAYPKGADTPSIRHEGHDGITRFAASMRTNGAGTQVRHLKVNTIFVELTPERARIRSNGLLTAVPSGGEGRIALTGIYAETFRKTAQGWLIQHCALHMDR